MSFSPGSGGTGSSLSGSTDVALNNPANGEILAYASGIAKWQNLAAPNGGGSGSSASVLVASSDAPSAFKAAADFVCDGTSDEVQINSAINLAAPLMSRNAAMPSEAQQRGTVQLSGGRFNISSPILCRTAVAVQGMGFGTEVRAVANNGAGVFTLASVNDHLCTLANMYIEGNYASGGTCNAIDFDMTSSTSTANYPSASPDSYHYIHSLLINGFKTGTRHGIYLHATGTANNRGNIVTNCQIRNISGNGIYFASASDSFISSCHVGTIGGSGFRIEAGNTKLMGCKSFYCDTYGFYFGSGRHVAGTLESQDDTSGYYLGASNATYTGLCSDTSSADGIVIAASGQVINGFNVFLRASARYSTQAYALRFASTYSDVSLVGRIDPSNMTTPISGSPGARSFMRVSDGSSLVSVG